MVISARSARQQLNYNNEDLCFLRRPCRDVISGTSWELQYCLSEDKEVGVRWPPAWESVEWNELVGESVRELLRFSRCELLLLETGS
jgi:hypothetical protein